MIAKSTLLRTLASLLALGCLATAFAYPGRYNRLNMIDIDQRWDPIPNNGNMYCVPTAYLNLLEYMERNGLQFMDGMGGNPINLGFASARLIELGILMGTHPTEGSGSSLPFEVFQDEVTEGQGSSMLFTNYFGAHWDWGTNKIRTLLVNGSLLKAGFGRYYLRKLPGSNTYRWIRDGGHAFVISGYDYRSNPLKLLVANPANGDDDLENQSVFQVNEVGTRNITLNTLNHGEVAHAMYSLDTGSDGDLRRVIDGMTQVIPAYGGWNGTTTSTNNRSSANPSHCDEERIKIVMPFRFTPDVGSLPTEYEVVPVEPIVDWVFDIGELAVYYVTHLGRIFRVDLEEPRHHKLLHVIKGTKKLMIGGSSIDLYALVSGNHRDKLALLERDSNQIRYRNLPTRAVGLEYDPISGGPAVLLEMMDQMLFMNEDMENPQYATMPELPDGPGEVIFKIDHNTGNVILSRVGFNEAQIRIRDPRSDGFFMTMPLPVRTGVKSLTPAEGGKFIVQDGDELLTCDQLGRLTLSQFTGLQVDGPFKMGRSHVAGHPQLENGPDFRNIWPPDAE